MYILYIYICIYFSAKDYNLITILFKILSNFMIKLIIGPKCKNKTNMLLRFSFLLLLLCVVCVLLFFTLMEKGFWLHAPKINSIRLQPMYSVAQKSRYPHNRIIIEPQCNATFLTWIITSYTGDPSARSALRRAYTNKELQTLGIERVFLLGVLDENAERKTRVSRAALLDESRRFNDILLGDFLDTYRNLTRKHLMGLRWIVKNCKHVTYIMKTDDDIVVDVYGILDKLRSGIADQDSIVGYLLKNMVPVREPANKWYVSETEYTGSVYPDFVSGWLYFAQQRIAKRLVDNAESFNYFWIDDVFVTGILRQASNAKIHDISQYYTTDYRYLECCIKGKENRLKCEFLIGPNGGNADLQVKFKEFTEFCRTNCTIRTKGNLVGETCVVAYKEPISLTGAVQIDAIRIL